MMNKLSIIIPVYNVEKYLRKCVDSLLAQDYDDYEIILVDDGSTDSCPSICDEYGQRGKREEVRGKSVVIRVIHQKNGGLSAARNAGVKAAKGEYICFVDSDDYWEPSVLGGLMEQIDRDNLDVLRFKFQNVRILTDNDEMSRDKSLNDPLTLNDVKYEVFLPYKRDNRLENDYSDSVTDGVTFLNERMNTQCYAVMFIVKRSLLVTNEGVNELANECLFTPGIYFEDTDWTPRMLCRAKRVASTDTIVYNYLVREGSISRAVSREKQQKVLDDKMRLIEEMQRQARDMEQKGLSNAWFSRMIAANVISIIGVLSADFYDERKAYLEQLAKMNILPIADKSFKGRLINLSAELATCLLYLKKKVI